MSATLIGRKLGKYQLVELAGHGGMATVYKGYQADVDRYVAVKVLPPHPGQQPGFVDRFRQEARTVARLQHPHILPLYDYGDENDVLFLVTPFIDGGSLADRISAGALELPEVERLLTQVASALDFAHRQGIIHRDIKPDNILLNSEGFAVLGDFGIAKLVAGSGLNTASGLIGTPAYIAPEQAQGSTVDSRADIYALGIVVFEMLTGQQPYASETPVQIIIKHINAPPPRLSDVRTDLPDALNTVLERALAKEPADRYQTAGLFAEDFRRAVHGEPLSPTVYATITQTSPNLKAVSKPVSAAVRNSPTNSGLSTTPPPTGAGMTTIVNTGGTNPVILFAGFALIAALLVLVLVVLINQQNTNVTTAPTQVAGVNLDVNGNPDAVDQPDGDLPAILPVANRRLAGTLSYATSRDIGDTVRLDVTDLPPAGNGASYIAWLENTETGDLQRLPTLTIDALGRGGVTHTAAQSLATDYNRIFITREVGETDTPSENVVYSGEIPVAMMISLREILVASADGLPTGDPTLSGYENTPDPSGTAEPEPLLGGSLLEGAQSEADIGQRHAGLAAGSTNVGSMRTHAEHTINILQGTFEDFNADGNGQNPGEGTGVIEFLDLIETRLSNSIADADPSIQGQVELIRVCMSNARGWIDEVIALERELLAADSIEAVQAQMTDSTRLISAVVDGVDLNGDGGVEPFEGECGLAQIETFGVSVANINLYDD